MSTPKLYHSMAVAMLFTCAHGSLILQDFYAPLVAGGAPSQLDGGSGPWGYEIDVTSEFSAAGHGKLIMVYSSKDESGDGVSSDFGGAPVSGISYGGADLEEAIFHFDGAGAARVTVGIYYLDDVVSDGILRIELGDQFQTEFGFGLYALDGLKPGVQDTASVAGSDDIVSGAAVTITTGLGFVVQEAARNNQSLTASSTDAWETLYDYNGPQSYQALSQYQLTTAPGEYFAPINNTGSFKRISSAAFEALVPEPSSLALTAIGLLVLLARRRQG